MRTFTRTMLILFLTLFTFASDAYGDILLEGAAEKRPGPFGKRALDLGFNGFSGGDDDNHLTRKLLYARLSVWTLWRFFTYAHGGFEWISLESGQPQTSIESAQVSAKGGALVLGGGIGFVVPYLETRRFRLTLFGEGEFTPYGAELNLDSLEVYALGQKFDAAEVVKRHVQLRYTWYLVRSGAVISYRFGRVAPFLSVAYFRLDATIEIEMEEGFSRTLATIGAGNVNPHDQRETENTVLGGAGVSVEITRTVALNASLMIIPIDGRVNYGGQTALSLRF